MPTRIQCSGLTLRTLGVPALVREDGTVVRSLRRKDLALLVYLRLEWPRAHTRSALTSLLWDGPEEAGRHSLSQALGRIRAEIGDGALVAERDCIQLSAALRCDAPGFDGAELTEDTFNYIVQLGPDQFLAHFDLGNGASDFDAWADEKRAGFRQWLVRELDKRSLAAERCGRLEEARSLALQLTRIEPLFEAGHRRVMRTWSASGERGLALVHYEKLSNWLKQEYGEGPDPATRQLAEELRRA